MRKKVLMLLLTFLVIYVFTFFVPRWMPGDPFDYLDYADTDTTGLMNEQHKAVMREYYGMDKPLMEQFVTTLTRNLSGDLGTSTYYKGPVINLLKSRLGWSLYMIATTQTLSLIFGLLLARESLRHRRLDSINYSIMTVLAEVPAFLVGIALLFFVAAPIKWIPLSGAYTSFAHYNGLGDQLLDILLHSLMPVLAMVLVNIPMFYFTARSSFLAIQEKKYVFAAHAKGLSNRRIWYRYILLNAIMPIAARFFLCVARCVGATLLVENVFAYPGLGKLMRDAVFYRDYPLIQGVFLVTTVIVLLSSFLSDVIGYYIDKEKDHDKET
jgi:peptide/nickel transport system permease protein